ncbi:MAG TPA: hypothetical protein VGK73_02690 [Polyangiaceae bacterium]
MASTRASSPPPPFAPLPDPTPPPPRLEPAAAEPAATATGGDFRSSSVPPPPPRRRTHEAPAAASEHRPEDPPPHRPRPDELPVIPRLDVPRVARDGSDPGTRSASTIPPAPRATTIRSPSEVLQARSAPVSAQAASSGFLTTARSRFQDLAEGAKRALPEGLKEKLAGTSPAVIATAGGLGSVFLIGVVIAIAGIARPSGSKAAEGTAESETAAESSSSGEASSAAAAPAESAALARPKLPAAPSGPTDETTVLLDLSESMLAQRRDADAVSPLERLITRHPELKDNDRLGRILLRAAASTDRQAASQAHGLLTGPMGESGAALLYELSLKPELRDGVRQRVQTWLASKDFERVAPLPVYAAVRLRNAASCEDKHALLEFAGKAGGKYVLTYLKELESKKACAPDDLVHCYPCMRNDTRLTETIARLEGR